MNEFCLSVQSTSSIHSPYRLFEILRFPRRNIRVEAAIPACPLPCADVTAHHKQIQRISHSVQVVFLQLRTNKTVFNFLGGGGARPPTKKFTLALHICQSPK